MREVIEGLKDIIENPDDLSSIPGLVEKLTAYQKTNEQRASEDLERITKLQDANRNLLAQIPVNTGEPEPKDEPGEATFEQAQEELLKAMQNMGGN